MGAIQTSQGAAEGRELTSPEARLNAKLRLMQAERSHSSGAPHILPDLTTLPQPGARPANLDAVEINRPTQIGHSVWMWRAVSLRA
jgi:hypothetical protein